MAAQSDKPALRLLSGPAACMTASWCICMARGIVPPRISVVALAPWARDACHGPRTIRSRAEVVRGETCRARWRLVMRGGDLSWGPLLWGTSRRCCQLVRDLTSCQCGSWPGSSVLFVSNLDLDIVNLGLHVVNDVGLPCAQGGSFRRQRGPYSGPSSTVLSRLAFKPV
jgi:hypothetical protein